MDIGFPPPPALDLIALGDFVAELNAGIAVKPEIGLFVGGCGAIGVFGDFAVPVFEKRVGGAGEARKCVGEGSSEGEGGMSGGHDGLWKNQSAGRPDRGACGNQLWGDPGDRKRLASMFKRCS